MFLIKFTLAPSMLSPINHLKCRLPMCLRIIAACVIVVCAARETHADGLIYQLPADGAWVRYDAQIKFIMKAEGKEEMSDGTGSLLLSSVGQARVKGEPCRWIEIAATSSPPGAPKNISRIVKLLIPEKRLKRGEDPFAHVLDMHYSQGGLLPEIPVEQIEESDKIPGADYSRRQYELDRLRSVFPQPLKDVKTEKEAVESKLGNLTCEKLTGKSELPKSPLRGGGEFAWNGEFQCSLNEKVPFGVVSLRSHTKGFEKTRTNFQIDTTWILTVAEIGRDAKSALPNPK